MGEDKLHPRPSRYLNCYLREANERFPRKPPAPNYGNKQTPKSLRYSTSWKKVQEKMQKKYGKRGQAYTCNVRSATWSRVLERVGKTAEQWSESNKASNFSVFMERIGRNSNAFQG